MKEAEHASAGGGGSRERVITVPLKEGIERRSLKFLFGGEGGRRFGGKECI